MGKFIKIKGAKEHNLQDISVDIPRNKLVVITGLSGSGKSSLAFDTIYAEGQRRYLESLSAYARQFLEQMKKPAVNSIDGLSPSISIEQKNVSRNPRSTVGTITEIYDYLRLLFARAGVSHCYSCGKPVQRQSIEQIVDQIMSYPRESKFSILAPVVRAKKGEYRAELSDFRRQGYVRAHIDGKDVDLGSTPQLKKNLKHDISIYIDRLVLKPAVRSRVAEATELAAKLADGIVEVKLADSPGNRFFSTTLACVDCGISYQEVEPRSFSFNSPQGSCDTCSGLGVRYEFDPDKIVVDPKANVGDNAILPWALKTGAWKKRILSPIAKAYETTLETPFGKWPKEAQTLLLYGSGKREFTFNAEGKHGEHKFLQKFEGVIPSLERRKEEAEDESEVASLEPFMSPFPCTACEGTRLKPQALSVYLGKKNIHELCTLSISECLDFVTQLKLEKSKSLIAKPILKEVIARLEFLDRVGLDYLSLSRGAATLSGGESQRIRLATQIGSHLIGVLYVLDEPSIGLHQRDNHKLIESLEKLRDGGNSVIVVEHDEDTIRRADFLIDIGPGAGRHGGELTFSGNPTKISSAKKSLTGEYLSGKKSISLPKTVRKQDPKKELKVIGARKHNLKSLDVSFPLGNFICVSGVSGSGKSSLIIDSLLPSLTGSAISKKLVALEEVKGKELIDKVIHVDQKPIGRTPRSNTATYTGTFTEIRNLFASLPEAKMRGYKPSRFSFNVPGGRCEPCRGDGNIKIVMNFLPDVYVPCEICRGKRYNRETLQVLYRGKNISDVLEMPIEEAASFFERIPKLRHKFETLLDVGLGYIQVGQSAVTLSGGEAQRVKLSKELVKRSTGKTLFILDEPTTGLHFADVEKLIQILHRLVDQGNTVVVIEHHLDVIKQADYVLDLGPEGGENGGKIVYAGPVQGLIKEKRSYTGKYLRKLLEESGEAPSPKKKTTASRPTL